jgi:hypothetical protein
VEPSDLTAEDAEVFAEDAEKKPLCALRVSSAISAVK